MDKAALLDPLMCCIDPCDPHKKVMGACRQYSHVVLLRRLHQHVDFVVCLGGDGTILHASSLFQQAIPPVISFSAGSLGFLTNHSLQNVESDLRAVIYGSEDLDQCSLEEEVWLDRTDTQSALSTCFSMESSACPKNSGAWAMGTCVLVFRGPTLAMQMRGVHITLRMRLECKIIRQRHLQEQNSNSNSSSAQEELYEVMNEVVVDRGANPYLAKIECWERDTLITKVSIHLIPDCSGQHFLLPFYSSAESTKPSSPKDCFPTRILAVPSLHVVVDASEALALHACRCKQMASCWRRPQAAQPTLWPQEGQWSTPMYQPSYSPPSAPTHCLSGQPSYRPPICASNHPLLIVLRIPVCHLQPSP